MNMWETPPMLSAGLGEGLEEGAIVAVGGVD